MSALFNKDFFFLVGFCCHIAVVPTDFQSEDPSCTWLRLPICNNGKWPAFIAQVFDHSKCFTPYKPAIYPFTRTLAKWRPGSHLLVTRDVPVRRWRSIGIKCGLSIFLKDVLPGNFRSRHFWTKDNRCTTSYPSITISMSRTLLTNVSPIARTATRLVSKCSASYVFPPFFTS